MRGVFIMLGKLEVAARIIVAVSDILRGSFNVLNER